MYSGTVERKSETLPCYVVVPSAVLEPWGLREATVVDGVLNGIDLGRRTLKPWDAKRWFVELPQALCSRASVSVGDRVDLEIGRASTELPLELAELIETSPVARKAWRGMTSSQQRMLREHVIAAKRAETRRRRAEKGLLDGAD